MSDPKPAEQPPDLAKSIDEKLGRLIDLLTPKEPEKDVGDPTKEKDPKPGRKHWLLG